MFERGKKEDPARAPATLSRSQESPMKNETERTESSGPREAAVIGRSIQINGDLRGEEDLRIEGDVTGTIQLKNNSLTIGKDGRIKADVYAKAVYVDGLIEGDIYGSERVSIRKNARVTGNVISPRVSLEEGARFKGAIDMDSEAVEAALGKAQPQAKPAVASAPPLSAKPAAAVSTVKS
jgi:cytoskeletal protein CcmA (bactofilin family)